MFIKFGPRFYNTHYIHKVNIREHDSLYYVDISFTNGDIAIEEFGTRKDADAFAFKLTQAKD